MRPQTAWNLYVGTMSLVGVCFAATIVGGILSKREQIEPKNENRAISLAHDVARLCLTKEASPYLETFADCGKVKVFIESRGSSLQTKNAPNKLIP